MKRIEPGHIEVNNFRSLIADGLAKQRNDCCRCKENNKKFEEKSLAQMSQLFSRLNFNFEPEHEAKCQTAAKNASRNGRGGENLKLPAINTKTAKTKRANQYRNSENSLSGFYEHSHYSQFGGTSINTSNDISDSKPSLNLNSLSSIGSVSSESICLNEIKNIPRNF